MRRRSRQRVVGTITTGNRLTARVRRTTGQTLIRMTVAGQALRRMIRPTDRRPDRAGRCAGRCDHDGICRMRRREYAGRRHRDRLAARVRRQAGQSLIRVTVAGQAVIWVAMTGQTLVRVTTLFVHVQEAGNIFVSHCALHVVVDGVRLYRPISRQCNGRAFDKSRQRFMKAYDPSLLLLLRQALATGQGP